MNKHKDKTLSLLQHLTTSDPRAWKAYWETNGQPWRSEPEISAERQAYLAKRRAIEPNIEKEIYPFKDIKLNRADVEWLLATHENGQGPVDWGNRGLLEREGLDLRGADLQGVNLRRLPLTATIGALDWDAWLSATVEQREAATTHLERANLSFAHLERAILRGTHLEKADLYRTHLEEAYLYTAHLEGAILKRVIFDSNTQLGKSILSNEEFGAAVLDDVGWNNVNLTEVNWELVKALSQQEPRKNRRDWTTSDTQGIFNEYHRAIRTDLQLAHVLQEQGLNEVSTYFAYRVKVLQRRLIWLHAFQQKLNLLQKTRNLISFLFSLFLDILAGYGYRPWRSFLWYLIIIFGFAMSYYTLGHLPLLPDAFVYSLTSLHGRGFFPGFTNKSSLHEPLIVFAALEAVIGLFIEISFIATFTQRYLGK